MKKALILCSVLISLVLSGMLYMNYSQEKETKKKQNEQMFHKAEQVAITYFKEKRHKDLIVKKTDFAKHGFDYLEVIGYVKGEKHTQYLVNVSYNQNYRISSIAATDENN
ncbi:hypothetical protein MOF32_14105 [Priestia megaterium]|uniref:hypothetical protein n=1 Tax=Priestia megaterium TaxID=1404 RepID=UPI002282DEE1|nr:hypothetical protein [Priestia megaterium]MCY9024075.1 hypothetical protein [Priestia megaterium]